MKITIHQAQVVFRNYGETTFDKSAYHRLIKKHHPDVKGGSAEASKAINEAWDLLKTITNMPPFQPQPQTAQPRQTPPHNASANNQYYYTRQYQDQQNRKAQEAFRSFFEEYARFEEVLRKQDAEVRRKAAEVEEELRKAEAAAAEQAARTERENNEELLKRASKILWPFGSGKISGIWPFGTSETDAKKVRDDLLKQWQAKANNQTKK